MELSKQSNHQNPPDRLLITLRLSFWNRRRSVDVECDLTLLLEKVNVSGWNWTAPQGPVVEWKHQLGSGDLVCFDSETCGKKWCDKAPVRPFQRGDAVKDCAAFRDTQVSENIV